MKVLLNNLKIKIGLNKKKKPFDLAFDNNNNDKEVYLNKNNNVSDKDKYLFGDNNDLL